MSSSQQWVAGKGRKRVLLAFLWAEVVRALEHLQPSQSSFRTAVQSIHPPSQRPLVVVGLWSTPHSSPPKAASWTAAAAGASTHPPKDLR
ncbi:hypothetical protein E2320_007582 [Naja naja]|nr:hypothetical protein E2320_007582 [Naja naja]